MLSSVLPPPQGLSRGRRGVILTALVRHAFLRLTFALGLALSASSLAAFGLAGCKDRPSEAKEVVLTLPTVTDASADLLLTWIDDKGEFHVEQKVADVPVAARDVVRVVDPAHDPPTSEDVFVVDLRTAGANGAYPVRTMKRTELDALAVARRSKHGAVLAATPPGSGSNGPHGPGAADQARPAVIIYGASWCGPCHQAAAYLKKRGVAFVEKDIEADGSAGREMQAKLAKAGKHGGSIPVLDVRGKILIGFDPGSVDRALGEAM